MKRIVAGALLLCLAGTASAWEAGARVLGRWSDGFWYPARIAAVSGATIQLNYDDGEVAATDAAGVRKVDWKAGTRLQCNWKNQGKFYPGVIKSLEGEVVAIDYDDGDHEQATIARCRSL